jgi:hypothetical protein
MRLMMAKNHSDLLAAGIMGKTVVAFMLLSVIILAEQSKKTKIRQPCGLPDDC